MLLVLMLVEQVDGPEEEKLRSIVVAPDEGDHPQDVGSLADSGFVEVKEQGQEVAQE